jgi:hypothetical protein
MLQNKAQERMMKGTYFGTPERNPAESVIPYEMVDVVMWDFNLPSGPSQFMIEEAKGDFVKEEKDRFKIRCRQDGKVIDVCIYKAQLYFNSAYATQARVRIIGEAPGEFVPSKSKI